MSILPAEHEAPVQEVKPESVIAPSEPEGGASGGGEPAGMTGQDVSAETREPDVEVEAKSSEAGGVTASPTRELEQGDVAPVSTSPVETADTGAAASDAPAEVSSVDAHSEAPAPAVAARVPTPSSRTSTPPVPSKKKFSSVSVTKEFLSKAVSPVPAPTKQARPAAAAAAPAQTTHKLLSSKLTTVPSSKPSTTPNPPGSAVPSSSSSSPWAKPTNVDTSASLQHPAPTRSGLPNVAMGAGQGLGRRAWGPVSGNESRRGHHGISRDYPTATEVEEGKRKAMLNAQAIAQAEAAHNQAILADLNAFTHIEANAHRWDEEDEDEGIIDFGDGHTYSLAQTQPPREPEPTHDEPVAKSERFGEDMGRSWPRRAASPQRQGSAERVLFNANSNRLEPSVGRQGQQAPPQAPHQPPVRLMSRDSHDHERAAPPHMAESNRMLPPHMGSSGHPPAQPSERRNSWRAPPSSERQVPPHIAEHRQAREELQAVSRPPPPSTRVPPRPPQQQAAPPPPKTLSVASQSPVASATALPADEQSAEMHSAAEKARLRRLAEETEREAAAERARQKARELAERFGSKPPSAAAAPAGSTSVPPPGLAKPGAPPGLEKAAPQITIAARPKPVESALDAGPAAPADAAQSWRRSGPLPESRGAKGRRPSNDQRGDVPHDLRRAQAQRDVPPHVVPVPISPVKAVGQHDHIAAPVPQSSKREANFDTMLARLQAAMHHARVSPPPGMERAAKQQEGVEGDVVSTEEDSPRPQVAEAPKPKPKPQHFAHLPPEYFAATQLEIPKSPPPAWRIYTVKLPSVQPENRGSIPRWRIKLAESARTSAPKGWWMTYVPPIANLPPSQSLADLLLPQPIGRRFAKQVDTGPIISISPRQLLPFERKTKRRPTLESRPEGPPSAPVAELSQTEPALHTAQDPLLSQGPGRLAMVNTRLGAPQPTADKAPVRFMVSSELDGDSLLEEVNKMSLEHIGEGEDKGAAKSAEPKKPLTPPPAASSQTLNVASPNAEQGPWAKSTLAYNLTSPGRGDARSDVQQRERVKSVWEQSSSEATAKAAAPASQPDTPLYPSLNSPAVSHEVQAPKGGYAMSQQSSASAFGSRSSFSQAGAAYGQFRGSGTTSPDASYGLNRNGGTGSANGFQPGLWAPAVGFGNSMASPGYGYKGMEKNAGGLNKDAAAYSDASFRYGNYQQQGQAYNGFPQGPQGQYRSPTYNYGQHGFGTQMAGRTGSAGGGRFMNGEYQPGVMYDGYYQGSYEGFSPSQSHGQAGGGGGGGGAAGLGRVGRKMW